MGTTTQTGMGLAIHTPTCNYNPTGRSICKERIPSMESASQTGEIAAVSALDDDDGDDDNFNSFNLNVFVVISIFDIHTLFSDLVGKMNQYQRQRCLRSVILQNSNFRFHGSITVKPEFFLQGNGCTILMWL